MLISQSPKKLFGMALDAADDPLSLQLKHAWMAADTSKLDWLSACPDPYGAVTESMAGILEERNIQPVGRFPVPSWLWPKPKQSDLPLVTAKSLGDFYDSGGLLKIVRQLQSFVTESVLPETPIMLGIDHSATAGVISALSESYSPGDLSVVVLDQHFDAIPLSVRLAGAPEDNRDLMSGAPFNPLNTPAGFNDQFCCGNFWGYLMDEGKLSFLIIFSLSEYPITRIMKLIPPEMFFRSIILTLKNAAAVFSRDGSLMGNTLLHLPGSYVTKLPLLTCTSAWTWMLGHTTVLMPRVTWIGRESVNKTCWILPALSPASAAGTGSR